MGLNKYRHKNRRLMGLNNPFKKELTVEFTRTDIEIFFLEVLTKAYKNVV